MDRDDCEDSSSFFLQELLDVLAHIFFSLAPRDLCNLSLTCKKLHNIYMSYKLLWPQCNIARQIDNLSSSSCKPPRSSPYVSSSLLLVLLVSAFEGPKNFTLASFSLFILRLVRVCDTISRWFCLLHLLTMAKDRPAIGIGYTAWYYLLLHCCVAT